MSKHTVSALCFKNLALGPEKTEILLICESTSDKYDSKESWMWQLPGGKCCNNKYANISCCLEKPAATSIREFHEETGLQIIEQKLCWEEELVNRESREKYMRHVYLIEQTGGAMKENETPSGNKSPQWFKLTAIPRNLFKSHQDIIRIFFRREKLINRPR